MIDFDILKEYGTTNESLKALFLQQEDCDKPNPLIEDMIDAEVEDMELLDGEELNPKDEKKLRKRMFEQLKEKREEWLSDIEDRLEEGQLWNVQNYRFYLAADIAFDGKPVVSETFPLMLYAQNKIDAQACAKQLKESLGDDAEDFIVEEGEDKISINTARFTDTALNLVRPFITRRVAAQANRFQNLYPFFKYESRSKTQVGNLRADAISQRVEIITDQYGYRPEFTQWLRRCFMHGHSVTFVEGAWDCEKQVRKRFTSGSQWEKEEVVTKEGLRFVTPHPTRVFYDMAYPLSSINYDKGCSFLGYWDVLQVKDVKRDTSFFNRSKIKMTSDLDHFYSTYKSFFDAYYPDRAIKFYAPVDKATNEALRNDRKTAVGMLSDAKDDQSVFVATYYEKVVPKEKGFGDYPHPVWVKLIVANHDTVVHAEILPSTPACYMGYNEDDGRLLNQGMAHEILPYQDQVENLMSQLVYLMRLESFMIFAIDADQVSEENREYIKKFIRNGRFHSEAIIAEYDGGDEEALHGKNPVKDTPFKIQTSDLSAKISETFKGITDIIALLEKTQMFSPQELGQFVEREVSASEVLEVANTTTALFNFISQGPDDFRAAMKRIIYESYLAMGSEEVYIPVVDTYPDHIIEAAGFKVTNQEDVELLDSQSNLQEVMMNLTGTKTSLVHDYIFNSRDGAVRSVSVDAAQAIFQFLSSFMGNPEMIKKIGERQLFEMIAEAFRLSGTTISLKFNTGNSEGEDDTAMTIEELAQVVQKNAMSVQEMDGALSQVLTQLGGLIQGGLPSNVDQIPQQAEQEVIQEQIQNRIQPGAGPAAQPQPASAVGPPNI